MSGLLHLSDVEVSRGGRKILGPMNWQVMDGERWVVLGPNGAGKTTFLQLLGAMIHPSKGTVKLLGETLGAVDVFELRPRIGMSSSALNDSIPLDEKVIDLVLTAAYAITGRWIEEYDLWDESRAKALLDIFGIRELAARTYGTLSEGEKKRAQIARALMADPEVLLLDEPAAGLDLGGREDILNRISRYLNEPDSPASVIVTHHIEEIPGGTTHALLLKNAQIFAAGPILETLTEANIKEVFGVDVKISFDGIRFFAASKNQ